VYQNNHIIKLKDIKFDIKKLINAFNEILQIRKFDNAGGVVTNISSISLNRINGDNPESTEGQIFLGKVLDDT
jgi:hypothetical protein